jgi:hypothetical protein
MQQQDVLVSTEENNKKRRKDRKRRGSLLENEMLHSKMAYLYLIITGHTL